MPASALVLDEVVVTLGRHPRILDGLSLTAAAGQVTCLLGPNGAGKTTAIRACTGLVPVVGGTIRVLGAAPGSKDARTRIGLMPQTTGAWSGIRPLELLRYLSRLYAKPLPVDVLAERLGIDGFAKTPYRRLSGGQQQTVNLAAALIGRPELVFLDEPTAGLDPHNRRASWDLIAELRSAGVAVLLTTHAMDEAARLADFVWIIDRGRIVLHGDVATLTRDASLEEVFVNHTSGGRP